MIDRHSPVWRAVRDTAMAEIEASQRRLEQHGADIALTEFHRGRIAGFRAILALDSQRSPAAVLPASDVYAV